MRTDQTADARAAGHKAAQKAAAALGREWQDEAVEAIRAFATKAAEFTAEEVRSAFPKLDAIAERRAWGSAFIQARDERIIEPRGAVPVVSSRGGYKTLWRSLVLAEPEDDCDEAPPVAFPPAFFNQPPRNGVSARAAH